MASHAIYGFPRGNRCWLKHIRISAKTSRISLLVARAGAFDGTNQTEASALFTNPACGTFPSWTKGQGRVAMYQTVNA